MLHDFLLSLSLFPLPLIYIHTHEHLFFSLFVSSIYTQTRTQGEEGSHGVNFVFFSPDIVVAAAAAPPSMCYFLLTVGWRSFSSSVGLDQWPRKERAMSLFSFLLYVVNGRRRRRKK
jgi:hypothetical protein